MEVLTRVLAATLEVYLIASPYILLGLAAAGLMHILIPASGIARWLGQPGFGATARAALLGIPLPLCSCAVVPVTIELSRKGASREASLAFLVSTPETGVDSILLTYGLMGPVMAVVRPLAALVTSLVAAMSSMLWRAQDGEAAAETPQPPNPSDSPPQERSGRLARALRYGFRDMVDEIGFWLVVGLFLTGLITALVPEDWIQGVLGTGPRSLVLLLLLGIPLYMCASASTPVGAALLLKGVSPGAALVFLLAGPATNASSLVVIARFFGRKFVAIYLSSVVVTALASGYLFDWLLVRLDWQIVPTLGDTHLEEISWLTLACAVFLGALLLASLLRGSWRMSLREISGDLRSWRSLLTGRDDEADDPPTTCDRC
jgi:uncharacterized membrane protein YraQ (UPF0718 family)